MASTWAPSPSHQGIVLELGRQIANALKGKPCRVYVAPFDVRLPKSTEDADQIDTVVQPDVEPGSHGTRTDAGRLPTLSFIRA
jgi:hypothetical protein